MKEYGEVVKIQGEIAKVRFKRTSACGKCGACGMLKDMSEIEIDVENTLGAQPGQKVEVEFAPGDSLKSAAIAYLIPLAMLLVGAFLGYIIGNSVDFGVSPDVCGAILAILFAVLSFFILRAIDGKMKKKLKNIYRMASVLEEKGA